ncbi:dTDP-4-dehydrorhamnose reductase [Carboxylicivirga sp. N1Y90]|uniref:dTDP-4-dehydrorhamnose reductase n=1 Tax=Carboxylicivirga fragile TaxID=3417571 RepID=UPI003D342536|nr:dTDP-4-dehydrorhamnose reductase [Marinilabiliaceae bacterium N1Y90]
MTKVLVIGSEGQLGQDIKSSHTVINNCNFHFTSIESLNVTDQQAIKNTIEADNYDYIINCTAYTAVDKAEEETILANEINHIALKIIGEVSASTNSKVIHVSTDYVFDGKQHRPYIESDDTCPNSVYGKTKLQGEQELLNSNSNSIIVRTSWLYSIYGNNFVKTMIRLGTEREQLGVIFDQVGTPTFSNDLANVILHIINCDIDQSIPFSSGIYHYSNEGVCSWYDFTLAIHQLNNISCKVLPIETKDYPTAAPRPHYSVLNKGKIKDIYKIQIPYWKDSLKKCIKELNS